MSFGNDSFLWYNVGDWAPLGLAVPNVGNDRTSANPTIRGLCNVVGRNMQAIMFHQDARLRVPPSINTLTRIHKLCVRARALMASRAIAPGTPNMESAHASPTPEEFVLYPTPYFTVRNSWMKEYAGLMLLALTDAIQDQENSKALEISTQFTARVGQYVRRVYRSMAVELFGIALEEADKADFTLTDAQLAAYNPASWFTSTELVDTVPDMTLIPTEDDLKPITDGIPVSRLPNLGPWPGVNPNAAPAQGEQPAASSSSFPENPSP